MLEASKILPINSWIIIEDIEPGEVSAGGIYIPEAARKKQVVKTCKVLSISADVYRVCAEDKMELQYKVGDIVCHYSQQGIPINPSDENDKTMFLKYDAVMAVIQRGNNE
ncbi:MAG: co-chaperone GroES family protein [Candidatus Thorarchaeota archaeon]|jgi:co-chaperonin GroES (HSP10)